MTERFKPVAVVIIGIPCLVAAAAAALVNTLNHGLRSGSDLAFANPKSSARSRVHEDS